MFTQDLRKISDWHLEGAKERKDKLFEFLSLPKTWIQKWVWAALQAAGAQVPSTHAEAGVVSKALPGQAV